MIETLYELLTGRPYRTVRSMAAEHGPPPAARHPELSRYSDAELMAHGPELLVELDAAAAAGRRPAATGGLPGPDHASGRAGCVSADGGVRRRRAPRAPDRSASAKWVR